MSSDIQFFIEVLISGLLTGVLYALISIGFVLIYKASGVFNFAQGAMVLFAAMTLAGIHDSGFNFLFSIVMTVALMIFLAWAVERFILRRIVNQSQISLFMATIGLSYILLGLGQLVWGAGVHALDTGLPDGQYELGEILIDQFDLTAAAICAVLVLVLAVFFNVREPDYRCERSRMIIRPPSRSGSPSLRCGLLFGASRGSCAW